MKKLSTTWNVRNLVNAIADWLVALIAALMFVNVLFAIVVVIYSQEFSAIWSVLKVESVVPITLLVLAYFSRYGSEAW